MYNRWIRDECTVYTPEGLVPLHRKPQRRSLCRLLPFQVSVKIDMHGRQLGVGLCRHDRMRLLASNEVIRAQKRRAVHRELFIGIRDRAGKRSVLRQARIRL